jgi:hypothetical protein
MATARIETPVLLGSKFLYAYVKEVCLLFDELHFVIVHQLLFIVELMLLQPLQVGKLVVAAWSGIGAVRRVAQ